MKVKYNGKAASAIVSAILLTTLSGVQAKASDGGLPDAAANREVKASTNSAQLQALEPIIDSAAITPPAQAERSSESSLLQGGVLLEESAPAGKVSRPAGTHLTFSSADPTLDLTSLLQRLLSGGTRAQWTAEQYRKLEYGVLGIVSTKTVFSRHYTVTQVLPGCPAALAGVQVGDVEIAANGHVFTADDDQRIYWHTVAGKAGTPVDIVISRHGEPITFHLTRMNIEDIENEKVRRMFERMLSLLGPPTN